MNSTADDNASTYFDNSGHPQLIFGSGRLGGAARDLFLVIFRQTEAGARPR